MSRGDGPRSAGPHTGTVGAGTSSEVQSFETVRLRSRRREAPPSTVDAAKRSGSGQRSGRSPRVLAVGDVFLHPGVDVRHRTIVVGVRGEDLYLVSICSYDEPERQDGSCVFQPTDLPEGMLAHVSYVSYTHSEKIPKDRIADSFARGRSKHVGKLSATTMKQVLSGMASSSHAKPDFLAALLGVRRKPMNLAPRRPTLRSE